MKQYFSVLLGLLAILLVPGCDKDDKTPEPTAEFSFKVSNLAVSFTNEATNSRYFSWNFGDNTTPSTDMAPGHAYGEAGTYTVTLTVTGRDGSTKQVAKQVTVTAPPNLVQGGKFDAGDEAKWTVMNLSPGVSISFANGKATWTGGSWGQAGIYQPIQVEAGQKYQVNMSVAGSGASDTWFEVYAGQATPRQGQDYNDGGKRLALNTWSGCGTSAFTGPLTSLSCDGTGGGVVQFPTSGTIYLVIRSGGGNLGTSGIAVDNIEMRPIQ